MTTLHQVELAVLGPLQARRDGAPVTIPGAKPRAILTMLGLHAGSVVSADTLVELLWGDDPPRTAAKALQTHISLLRRTLGEGFVLTQGAGWALAETEVDASRYKSAARLARDAANAGDTGQAVARFEEALALWRGIPELPDGGRGTSEKTRWIEGHAALVEDRADALLATGRAAEIIGELEAAVADAPLRERRWGQLMLALYRAGRQGDALGAYQRARAVLADELGIDPGPELRRLEAAIVAQDTSLEIPAAQDLPTVTRAVTFLLTDIEGSTAAWEADADAMAVALARHDELVEQVVTSRGGRLIKTRGEGDATFSVFERPSAAAAAAIELQEAIVHEPWALREPMRIRVALHTGEAELRDGDYFGRAVNRAARLRSLAMGGQILCSGATAELVIDSLPDDVALADLGMRELRNLARPEHVFELRLETADLGPQAVPAEAPLERPGLPPVLGGPGPFVGRGRELERLFSTWQTVLAGGTNAVLIAGEPGVGKTRLAGEWSRQAYDQGAVVIYGRCDEDLGAPYQPFAEALRSLVPCLGARVLRGLRGAEALLPLVPGLTDVLPDLAAPTRADPDTERYALFDAVVALLGIASAGAPVVLILDDLHWAAKATLLLLRHLLRFGEHARVQIVGTYRSTDLDRSHPLAAMLADLHRDGTANRLQLAGLDEDDVTAYVAEAGYDDEELARALASVTGGNPFFLIEALRHVDESGGRWDQSTLPQGVREAVSRRLSRLAPGTNKALAAAAVVGSRFGLELVERVVGDDLVDAFDEACKAGIVIEEPGGSYRFNHALVRQSLLAELPSVRRMRLHQRIATTLETEPGADDELLAELAHHYFECAWAGNAVKAVEYCRRAADQAMARLAYEGAADLYDRALHALEEIDDELSDRVDQTAELLIARCEALLAAGDVASAAGAVSQLQGATVDSARLAAWATCFDGQLSMLSHPERLDETEAAVGAAAAKLAELNDAAGEAMAHTVRAGCLARLGRVGDCEIALDDALTAARRSREHRRVNAVLAFAPLAALWGPNPVPRAGGRCLDVVRLLRITTDSPAVEATSTRCQAVLEAFRGRAAAARRMIESARRTVTELGLRHALVEVEQFAGIVELVVDDPAAAEPHLRKAYNGFRRMGLDADAAETAALLGGACLVLGRDAEADELCTESERLAGHALKPSIAWRTLRARLLSRAGDHDEARRVAEDAVGVAERTDALVDHADACLALATVLGTAGDVGGSRAAAERAVGLYERKGAAALAERARQVLGAEHQTAPAPPEPPPLVQPDNACVRAGERVVAAVERQAWDEIAQMYSPNAFIESRRKVVGFTQMSSSDWVPAQRPLVETGAMRLNQVVIALRGERLALSRLRVDSADVSPGAPYDEFLVLYGIDEEGRFALQLWFDLDDIDAALAELDAAQARFEQQPKARRLENAATRVDERFQTCFTNHDWAAMGELLADDISAEDRRRVVNAGIRHGRDAKIADMRATADLGTTKATSTVIAIRGQYLALVRIRLSGRDQRPDAFQTEMLGIVEVNTDSQMTARVLFDPGETEAAIEELDARYLVGEAAPYARTWSLVTAAYAAHPHEFPLVKPDWVNIDHRRVTTVAPGDLIEYVRAGWDLAQAGSAHIEAVHRLDTLGVVFTHLVRTTSKEGFDAEWREVVLLTVEDDLVNRCELFDETDLDAALVRFDELSRPAGRPENAASQMGDRFLAHFAAGDWDAIAEMLADNMSTDDRRRLVSSGVFDGKDAQIANARAVAELWSTNVTRTVVATRGSKLALARITFSRGDEGDDAFLTEALIIDEINADERISALVVFDLDDFDAAVAELDARYLAGEAAAHARTWSVIARTYAALNRRELPQTTSDWVDIDRRRLVTIEAGGMKEYLRATFDATSHVSIHVAAVHRLSEFGAVVTHRSHATSQDGLDAEWEDINLLTVEGDLINRCELFDEAELDIAIERFDELSRPTQQLENAASQAAERFVACFSNRDWDAAPEMLADEFFYEDRRRVVGAGIRQGRRPYIADLQIAADLWAVGAPTVMAIRGDRLVLVRLRFSGRDQGPEAFVTDVLGIGEIDTDEQIVALVQFDPDDIDAAFEELDARYLAGEAAEYARTWSVVSGAYASMNRHELFATTPDWVNRDHRRPGIIEDGGLNSSLRSLWELIPNITFRIQAVHRLTVLGAVCSHVAHGVSQDGFDAEWRGIEVMTVDRHLISRCEIFDEADLDVAIAKFEELQPQAHRLENAASEVGQRILAHFATRDWDAISEMLADNFSNDDRRRVVGAGIRHGRAAEITNQRTTAELWATNVTRAVVATRGERLVLTRLGFAGRDDAPEAFLSELLIILEINEHAQILALVSFDVDDFDAALEELEARYLAGEAAPYASVWERSLDVVSELNRHEPGPMIERLVCIDHRRVPFADGDFRRAIEELWSLVPDARYRVQAIHALDAHGLVATLVIEGTDAHGNELQWDRSFFFDPDEPRLEIYEESDVDTALARFEELRPTAQRLENTASRMVEQFLAHFAVRDWDAMAELLTEDISSDDRRHTVNAGIRRGRGVEMANWRATGEVWNGHMTSTVLATRGERLALFRFSFASHDQPTEAFHAAALGIVGINDDNRATAIVVFDIDDIDAATAELDRRHLAGEAAAHAHTWSVIAEIYAAFNRHELSPATPDWVNIDHRRGIAFAPGEMTAYICAGKELTPDTHIYIETVHRLSSLGAVVTQVLKGVSREGFQAEWREIGMITVDSDRINRCELFDEADLDAALAGFEELQPPTRPLENAASQADDRFFAHTRARDWAAAAELLAGNSFVGDRRRAVNIGVWEGRDVVIANLQALAEAVADVTSTAIAIRGDRLALTRISAPNRNRQQGDFGVEMLGIVALDAEDRLAAHVMFDPDDMDAALQELDARYLAGEAATHAHAWGLVTRAYAALNRRQLPETTLDWVNIDHRRLAPIEAGGLGAYLLATWDLSPQSGIRIEAVHRLSKIGAVVTQVVEGTSHQGFDAEWRTIDLSTYEGDKINRCELFDEADLDAALARFDELNRAPLLENSATRIWPRLADAFDRRDLDCYFALTAADLHYEDRRKGLRDEFQGPARRKAMQAMFETSPSGSRMAVEPIAIRGQLLALTRVCYRDPDDADAPTIEMLQITEVGQGGLVNNCISFDRDDIDAAFEELDARYLAGEAAAHAQTWSAIARAHAGFNRHELPATTPDHVYIDHRPLMSIEGVAIAATLRATWDISSDVGVYIEAVHRLSDFGSVVTELLKMTSQEGFDAETRVIQIFAAEGDLISRAEVFDEADLDAALARFDELDRPTSS